MSGAAYTTLTQSSLFAVPAEAFPYLQALMAPLAPPTSLANRCLIQRALVADVITRFALDPIDALVFVGNVYADRFPHPES